MKIIGITGHIRVGKDTFFSLLSEINPSFKRYSFADALKADLRGFVWEKCEIDINTATGSDKELIRPLMIAYGCLQRNRGDGLHWVKRVESQIICDSIFGNDIGKQKVFPVITDFRFKNEVEYFKSNYDLTLVEIKRKDAPEPPEEEKINQPLLRQYVDYTIEWPTVGLDNLPELKSYVEKFLNEKNIIL